MRSEIANRLLVLRNKARVFRVPSYLLLRSWLHNQETEPRQQVTEVLFLHDEWRRVTNRHEVPKGSHFGQIRLEEFAMELSEECFELLAHMLDRAPMEQHEIEHFGPLADVFIPLGQAAPSRLGLHRKVLEE